MDIWDWVHDRIRSLMEEEPRLAWILYKLPAFVGDNEHERVEAAVAEALPLARARQDPWMEVYLRHWRLQDRIFRRQQASDGLPEAVSLLERAHRPDAEDCPQSVCVTQDLCHAYAVADGPGWAEERLQVSQETLDRITPRWPCWHCIASEYASALQDQGRYEQALSYLETQNLALKKARPHDQDTHFREDRVRALLALGRAEQALALNSDAHSEGSGAGFELIRRLDQARILLALNRLEDAFTTLPSVDEVKNTPESWVAYGQALRGLLQGGRLAWDLGTFDLLLGFATQLRERGAHRPAFTLGLLLAELCLTYQAAALGEACLDEVEPAARALRQPQPALEQIAQLRERLRAAWPPLPESPEALRAQVQGSGAPFDLLLRAAQTWPLEWDFVGTCTEFLQQRRLPGHAIALLERTLLAQPTHLPAAHALAAACLQGRDGARLARLLPLWERLGGEHAVLAPWYEALWREQNPGSGDPVEPLLRAVAAAPERSFLRVRLAARLTERGDTQAALEQLEQAMQLPDADPELRWDLIRVGSRMGRWDLVRQVSTQLGLPVDPGEGPIEERWGLCRVKYPDEDKFHFAVRTGPATARILQVTLPDQPSRYQDLVVFNPTPLNRPAEGQDPPKTWDYPVDVVLREGKWHSWVLDGVHPGQDLWNDLVIRIESEGFAVQAASGSSYRLKNPWTQEEVQGLLAVVGVPPSRTPTELSDLLLQLFGDQDPPMTFPALLDAVGEEEEAQKHLKLQESWGI